MTFSLFISTVLILNGMYDLLCSFSLLFFPAFVPFSTLHLSVFAQEEHREHPVVRRLLGYWLLTYGSTRLVAGLVQDDWHLNLAASLTYFIEAFCFGFEYFSGVMVASRSMFVCVTSMLMGVAVLTFDKFIDL